MQKRSAKTRDHRRITLLRRRRLIRDGRAPVSSILMYVAREIEPTFSFSEVGRVAQKRRLELQAPEWFARVAFSSRISTPHGSGLGCSHNKLVWNISSIGPFEEFTLTKVELAIFGIQAPQPPIEREAQRKIAGFLKSLECWERQERFPSSFDRLSSRRFVFRISRVTELPIEPVELIVVIVITGDSEQPVASTIRQLAFFA